MIDLHVEKVQFLDWLLSNESDDNLDREIYYHLKENGYVSVYDFLPNIGWLPISLIKNKKAILEKDLDTDGFEGELEEPYDNGYRIIIDGMPNVMSTPIIEGPFKEAGIKERWRAKRSAKKTRFKQRQA